MNQVEERKPGPFDFLNPFDGYVWAVIFGSILLLGIVLHYFDFTDEDEGDV